MPAPGYRLNAYPEDEAVALLYDMVSTKGYSDCDNEKDGAHQRAAPESRPAGSVSPATDESCRPPLALDRSCFPVAPGSLSASKLDRAEQELGTPGASTRLTAQACRLRVPSSA
mgnify:CR=1 FL=1